MAILHPTRPADNKVFRESGMFLVGNKQQVWFYKVEGDTFVAKNLVESVDFLVELRGAPACVGFCLHQQNVSCFRVSFFGKCNKQVDVLLAVVEVTARY